MKQVPILKHMPTVVNKNISFSLSNILKLFKLQIIIHIIQRGVIENILHFHEHASFSHIICSYTVIKARAVEIEI